MPKRKLLKPEEYASPIAAKAIRTALRKRPDLSAHLCIVPSGTTFNLLPRRKARIEILAGNPEIVIDNGEVHLKLHTGDAIVWNEPDINNSFICVADIFEHQKMTT
jgi:hypothetical protein